MEKELFVRAEEVARELGISKPYAYKQVGGQAVLGRQ